MYTILAQKDWLEVINKGEEFKPLVKFGNKLFDPENGLKPLNVRVKPLNEKLVEQARVLWKEAKENWTKNHIVKPLPVSTLESLIAESVAKIAVNNVVEVAKPAIDTYISETYGALPKRIEVVTPTTKNVIQGVVHEKFETVLKIVNQDIPVFLSGPAGSGKNVICKQVAEALGLDFYFSNAVTQEYKLTGFIDANGHYQETQFFKAFTNGGVFMLDEIDASTPEVLVILNAAIANKYFDFPTGKVEAHKDFRIIAGGNTFGTGADIEYTGRYQLDAASLDRFAIIEIDYSEAIENAISNGNEELVKFVRDFRKAVKKSGIKFVVSYRAIERLTKLEQVLEKGEAIKIALIKGLELEDVKTISSRLNSNTSYEEELKRLVA